MPLTLPVSIRTDFTALTDEELVLAVSLGVGRGSATIEDNRRGRYGTEEWTYDKVLESGRNYMVGSEVPMSEFKRHHRSQTTPWQRAALEYVRRHPDQLIVVEHRFPPLHYEVYQRPGGVFEIGLPHHDQGGERHYVTKAPFKTKILVNVD